MSQLQSELSRLQSEMLEKHRERKHEEVENIAYRIDRIHTELVTLRSQQRAES
ncbi:hypothetical protein [Marinoscillum furvescens]|nr:hypothetical protein [Marinoscillum furvescens]